MPELPDSRHMRFMENYQLSSYDSSQLTREKDIADYFEEAVLVGKTHTVSPKEIANVLINKKIDMAAVLPAALIQLIMKEKQKVILSENELDALISSVLSENQKAVEDYKKGKESIMMYLVGQVIRKAGKKIDANMVKDALLKNLRNTI